MKRREFFRIAASGSAVVLVPSLLSGCESEPLQALESWQGPDPEEQDIRIKVLSYAILAPNPHNKQPWIITLEGALELALFVDPTRLLPETDPPYRQIHIGQGTFLENLELAARHFGYRAKIQYFPEGMYGNAVLEPKPVARIRLESDSAIKNDPLFEHILARRSNKRPYDGTPLTQENIDGLLRAYETSDYSLSISNDKNQLATLGAIAVDAMKIETGHHRRDAETLEMFRFNDQEVEKYRDGISVANAGMTGIKKWIVETFFLSRQSAEEDPSGFGAQAIDITTSQTESAAAYGWITSATNTRLDQVKVGRAYERVNLTATALGIALHPLSQVLQEYSDMADLQIAFKQHLGVPESHKIQMFFRLGYAEPTTHTPRRNLGSFSSGGLPG